MGEQEARAALETLGRKWVQAYDVESERPRKRNELPLECVRLSSKICALAEIAELLGLATEDEFMTAIHIAEHGPKGIFLGGNAVGRMRRAGQAVATGLEEGMKDAQETERGRQQ